MNMPPEMNALFQSTIAQAAGIIHENMRICWKVKQFETFEELESFLNDGKNIINLQMTTHDGKIIIVYAVK